jgi:hypothetical protein
MSKKLMEKVLENIKKQNQILNTDKGKIKDFNLNWLEDLQPTR